MKTLVLAEKPSVGKEIARVLGCKETHKSHIEGPRYVVTWALGHLVELAEPEDYDTAYKTWRLEDLPIMPKKMRLKVIRETSHQFKAIAALAKRSDLGELVIATDAGREGELVARWIMELVNWRKPFKRLWISSQTDQAIRDGFARLKPGSAYTPLYQSAVCRAEADWLIGLNLTRALTSKYGTSLAAGRVQTPTLSMLIERERTIKEFRPVEYRTVEASIAGFQAMWRDPAGGGNRIMDPARAEAIRRKVEGQEGKVSQLKKTVRHEPQPLPYDLTELQRDANRRYGFSAKQTSSVLQKLYEQHKLVTYPRTDSRFLSRDMVPTFKGRMESLAGTSVYASLARPLLRSTLPSAGKAVDDSKVTDHHAIIPTEQYVNLAALSPDERKLFDLIARRFIAMFYPAHQYEETTVTVEVQGEAFTARGRVIKQAGWKDVYGSSAFTGTSTDEEDEENEASAQSDEPAPQLLPALTQGQTITVTRCSERKRQTSPPARHTEATLLTQMEKHNLGTPATRADIIEKLLSTDTIERQGRSLQPTGKGRQLIELVSGDLRSPDLTAAWERKLEAIAKGQGSMDAFLADIRQQAQRLVQEVRISSAEYKPHNLTHSKCPECSQPLQEVKTKRGKLLACINRECSYKRSAEPVTVNRRCPQCHKKMELHNGKAGKYVQCRRCNVVELLDDSQSGRSGKVNRRESQQLLQKYSGKESLGSSLGDALKSALQQSSDTDK
ncbi:DNA topoisomerase III [Paenibacillus sp. y28]|uniref:DNA topoisomerase III n=1 Tax=Paenibacillus sp. y28 TaxID=3129110 RepID=UPI00301ABDBB